MIKIGYAGRFKCEVSDGQENVIRRTGWIRNLMLDQGLKFLGNGASANIERFEGIYLGVGQKAVAKTDTALESMIAADVYGGVETLTPTHNVVWDGVSGKYMARQQVVKKFGPFTSSQNITELGIGGHSGNDVFMITRALVKDATGVASVLTVRKDFFLTITYELVQVWDISEATYKVQADVKGAGKEINVTSKLCDVGITGFQGINTQVTRFFADVEAFGGGIGTTITDHPSGERVTMNTGKGRWLFDENTLTSTATVSVQFSSIAAGFADGVKALRLPTTRGIWQVGLLDAAGKGVELAKDDTFEVEVSVQYERYDEEI